MNLFNLLDKYILKPAVSIILLLQVLLFSACTQIEDTSNYAYVRLAHNLNKHAKRYISAYELNKILTYHFNGHVYKLIPVYNCPVHQSSFLKLYTKQNDNYMKYYSRYGKKKHDYANVLKKIINRKTSGFCFLSIMDNKLSGIINIGSSTIKNTLEVGYITASDLSGNKVSTINLRMVIRFLRYIQAHGMLTNIYGLFATCHPYNKASQKVLNNNGFSYISYSKKRNRFYYLKSVKQ